LESKKELFSSRNTRVVSVNIDEPSRSKVARGFSAQQGFTFKIVVNKTAEKTYDIDKAYLVKATPTSYLIDGEGIVVEAHTGAVSPQQLQDALDKLP
jgi:peroxiredoxin